jgi:hypothetical protein
MGFAGYVAICVRRTQHNLHNLQSPLNSTAQQDAKIQYYTYMSVPLGVIA